MLDLQKYAKRAEADPGFRQRLLQDANRAIKDEFGEDLPYKLKCKEKLSFEIEAMDGSNDSNWEGVAGGVPGFGMQTIPPGYVRFNQRDFPLNSVMGPNYISYKDGNGNRHTYDIKEIEGHKYVKIGNLNDGDLEGAAGGVKPNSEGENYVTQFKDIVNSFANHSIFFPYALPAKLIRKFSNIVEYDDARKRMDRVQNKAKHFTDGMGLNSNRK